MAIHGFGTNDAQTVKLWEKKLEHEVLPATLFGKFLGSTSDHAIQVKDDLTKSAGDRVRMQLSMLISGDGVSGNTSMEGNEENFTFYTDDLVIDQLRNAVRHFTRIDQQRVTFSLREESKVQLREWWADRLDRSWINQMTGNAVETDTKKTGMNAVTAPSSNHIIYGGNATSVATLNAGDEFTLDLIDEALTKIKMLNEDSVGPTIRPMKGGYYGCVLSPRQVEDLRTNTNTGQWFDIQRAAMEGGNVKDNPIFTGSLGVYNRVVFYEDSRIPKGNNAGAYFDNSRVAFLFGAQSCWLSFGRDGGRPNRFVWNEESFDYGNQHGVSAALIYGLKKSIFNSNDFAVIALPTYTTNN